MSITQAAQPAANSRIPCMSPQQLRRENRIYRGTSGVSCNNAAARFVPAFCDRVSGQVYRSRFADGRPAPFHLLDGLPEHLLQRSAVDGSVESAAPGLESGFTRDGRFYSRSEAVAAMQQTDISVP